MIDWGRVTDLRSEIGDDGFDEVIDLFLEETDEVAAGLATLDEAAAIAAALHFLKGSALNLGFCDLASLCQDGERLAAAGDHRRIDLARVQRLYRDTRTAFLAQLCRDAA